MIEVRPLDPSEWEIFRDLRLQALVDSPDAFGSTLASERDLDEAGWRGWLTGDGWDADVRAFAAQERGVPVGIAVCARFHREPTVAHLFAMWVRPSVRGSGAGRALVGAVAEHARSIAVDEVVLCVTEGNDAAFALYEAVGFVPTGEPPAPLRDGSPLRTRAMSLPLVHPDATP